jgi:hypothetical protein
MQVIRTRFSQEMYSVAKYIYIYIYIFNGIWIEYIFFISTIMIIISVFVLC